MNRPISRLLYTRNHTMKSFIFIPTLYLIFSLVQSVVVILASRQFENNDFNIHKEERLEQPQNLYKEDAYLNDIEDLEHIAYLSMRNFNLTDEDLRQSSWLTGLGNTLSHQRQHSIDDPFGSMSESSHKDSLAQMLESFIWRLRNGHIRRLHLSELESIADSLNASRQKSIEYSPNHSSSVTDNVIVKDREPKSIDMGLGNTHGNSHDRCLHLVAIYRYELKERQKLQQFPSEINENNSDRLMDLCKLAVECHSADDLVRILGSKEDKVIDQRVSDESSRANHRGSRGPREIEHEDEELTYPSRHKSLRDSVSMSLAKLCPMMLFQLHDEDGFCSIRKEDRPSMVTVWAFATLFVTIVSFCSLIGLSITPLIVANASVSAEASNDPNDSSPVQSRRFSNQHNSATIVNNKSNRACLTLFEGLAVGSLVGSALFSLIPQAFELQERESNQGFLLKALIIFFGIYLFYCSERLMRIILDTRQLRKKRKSLNQRSSNSLPVHFGHEEFDHHQMNLLMGHNVNQHHNNHRHQHESVNDKRVGNAVSQNRVSIERHIRIVDLKDSESKVKLLQKSTPDCTNRTRKPRQQDIKVSDTKTQTKNQRNSVKEGKVRRLRTRRHLMQVASKRQSQVKQFLPSFSSAEPMTNSRKSNDNYIHSTSSSAENLSANKITERSTAQILIMSEDENDGSDSSSDTPSHNERTRNSSDEFYFNRFTTSNKNLKLPSQRDLNLRTPSPNTDNNDRRHIDDCVDPPIDYFNVSQQETNRFQNQKTSSTQDIATVAWMIVLGDGIHNFIDGISIGAAFSESILSGVSISVAVICEEFPHELGDFAILVSSGMTVRQALGYNFLSACTCYLGMAVGIILGDVNDGASYISALAAGVFLYIALVDMMGELSATLEETCRGSVTETLKLLLLQNVGIFIGISIIFILSFIDF